jgi:hypothetical protein
MPLLHYADYFASFQLRLIRFSPLIAPFSLPFSLSLAIFAAAITPLRHYCHDFRQIFSFFAFAIAAIDIFRRADIFAAFRLII